MKHLGYRALSSSNGFSLIEAAVATTVVLVAVLASSAVYGQLSAARTRATFISSISSVESALTAALLDEQKYQDPDLKAALKSGNIPAGLSYQVSGSVSGINFNFPISPNRQVGLNSRSLQTCSSFPSSTCDIQLSLGMQNTGGNVTFAYKFKHQSLYGTSLLKYFGAGSSSKDGFTAYDFALPLPYEYLYNALLLQCPEDSVAVRGINRKTGGVVCVSQPKTACPTGTLGKSLRFNQSTNSVELSCSPATQAVSCPAKYALEEVSMPSLDAGGGKTATCVYQYAREGSGPTLGPVNSISETVCPEDYRSTSSCYLVNIQATNGQCPDYCDTYIDVADVDADGNPTGTTHQECSHWTTPPPNTPIAGYARIVQSGRNASCSATHPAQTCGATWDAQVEMNVHCTLAISEHLDAN